MSELYKTLKKEKKWKEKMRKSFHYRDRHYTKSYKVMKR